MRCLVTGAAGFIGSHLAERLVAQGHDVIGVDCFVPYYARSIKESNLAAIIGKPNFQLCESDLRYDPLEPLLDGAEVVFHLAAMPGLTASWTEFEQYMTCNLLATERLVESARQVHLRAFVHASTSSVYGRDAMGNEQSMPCPISPYGVTKLAAERLALAYYDAFGLPVVVLRYFSVYGPRQRPDMGLNIFIERTLTGEPVVVFGTGEQTRGSTFVADCVDATLLAAERGEPGEIYNVGGGEARSVNWVLGMIETLIGKPATIQHAPPRPGDQMHTLAEISKARRVLQFEPRTPLRDGLAAQVQWQQARLAVAR